MQRGRWYVNITGEIAKHMHPRLRYFLKSVFVLVVAWLSIVGLTSIATGSHKLPDPLAVGALLLGTGLASVFRPLQDLDLSEDN